MTERDSNAAVSGGGDYLDRLAQFVALTRFEDIPDAVIARAKDILVDAFAVIGAGMQAAELRAMTDRRLRDAAPGGAALIGTARRINALDASMLNGIAGAWHDFDEGNFEANSHPGITVIPTAFAVGQARRRSGRDVLAAIALGYEIVARIGAATTMKVIVNPHGTYGVVGAALVAARLTGLPPARHRALASLAASCCMATNRHTMLNGATVRNWYAGHCGTMGQMAVQMIESGFTAPADGVNTTFSLVLGDGFDPPRTVAGLGERWLLTGGYLKRWPTARYAHSGIDAFFDALSRAPGGRVAPEAIRRVDMRGYRMAAFLAKQVPDNAFGTRFSIPFACATLLVGGRNALDAFGESALADERVRALAQRIHVTEDPRLNHDYPLRQRVEVRVELADGAVLDGTCDITSGEPGNPHPPGAMEQKYRELAEPVWGAERALRLREALLAIDACPDVSALVDFEL